MSVHGRVRDRFTRVAFQPHLPQRTVRLRLTLLYGGLFLASGAALLAITYVLVVNATAGIVFKGQNGAEVRLMGTPPAGPGHSGAGASGSVSVRASDGRSIQLAAPRATGRGGAGQDTGVIAGVVKPLTLKQAQAQAHLFSAQAQRQHSSTLRALLIQSGIALAAMSLLSIALGWLIAGRVLQPLADSYEAQRRFVANASHELRTPLARQRALVQVALADPNASFASLRAAHERVLASEEQLERLIEALLTLSRGQAGLPRRERVDLAGLANQVLLTRESEAKRLGLDIETALASAPAVGDPRLVERLIANLIDNALLHNLPGGRVAVTVDTQGGRAVLSVTNTGPVVPATAVDRLFQPFQRLSADRTGHGEGTGLGLSIVQAIADAHGARVALDAQPEGGLRIEVSFSAAGAITPVAGEPPARLPLARV
jgi:signal transduction histidine kinase